CLSCSVTWIRDIYTLSLHEALPILDETQMFFQWMYLREQVQQREPGRPVDAGWYILRVASPDAMPRVATAVDDQFLNSRAPTKTDRKSTRLNSSHEWSSYAVFCLKK